MAQISSRWKTLVIAASLSICSQPVTADLDISALVKQQRSDAPGKSQGVSSGTSDTARPGSVTALRGRASTTDTSAQASFRQAVALDTPGASREALLKASDFYRDAAEQGHVKAQSALGLMYAQGHGVDADDKRAAFWLSKAAQSGNAIAQYSLGLLYYEGRGIEQDYERALKLYESAAQGGNAKAMNNLGIMHALGHGVREHNPTALAWFSLAVEAGSSDAESNAELLRRELPESQLEESKRIRDALADKLAN